MSKNRLVIFFSCYLVWCALNWIPGIEALIAGVFIAGVVTFLTEDIPVGKPNLLFFHPARYFYFLFYYLPVFWWQHFLANMDVAYRVLHPGLPIRPAVVRVKIELKSDMGITTLANSLSLVPGTTSVDVDQDKGLLYVHCMAVSPENVDGAARKIVRRFERILIKVFE